MDYLQNMRHPPKMGYPQYKGYPQQVVHDNIAQSHIPNIFTGQTSYQQMQCPNQRIVCKYQCTRPITRIFLRQSETTFPFNLHCSISDKMYKPRVIKFLALCFNLDFV